MTVGKLFRTMVFTPLIIAVFAYPIYLAVFKGISIYQAHSFLQMASVVLSHISLFVAFIIGVCYTICNWNEDLKSWFSYENLKYYLETGKPNSKQRRY